jgi:hypothetical protein
MSWLDGTMIANAADSKSRVLTLLYLLRERYQLDARAAGNKLHRDYSGDESFRQLLDEIRAALQTKDAFTSGTWSSDAEARQYLVAMLVEYDRSAAASSSNDHA